MNWKFRKVIQDFFYFTPGGIAAYDRLMNRYNSRHHPNYWIKDKLNHAEFHFNSYYNHFNKIPENVVELGTGWFPLVPLFLSLMGIEKVYSLDVFPHLNQVGLHNTLKCLQEAIEQNAIPLNKLNQHKVKLVQSFNLTSIQPFSQQLELMKSLGIEFHQIDSKSQIQYPKQLSSIQQIVSNNTLSCVKESHLSGHFAAWRQILAKGGMVSHHIDLTDPRSHVDPSIRHFDFLKYSKLGWAMRDSIGFGVNRIRLSQWIRSFEEAGFSLVKIETIESNHLLNPMKLNEAFRSLSSSDLTTGWFTLVALRK